MMNISSDFLIHWTGHDIEELPEDKKKVRYVKRLCDDLQQGLYAKRKKRELSVRHIILKNIVRICFTERSLSEAKTHATQFGRLGIGFTRDFVVKRGGQRMAYFPYEQKQINYLTELSAASKWTLAHAKRAASGKDLAHPEFKNFEEEKEYRIVYHERPNESPFTRDHEHLVHRLPFGLHDLKIVIFPDEQTKELALKDKFIKEYFSVSMPIIMTLDECEDL